MMETMVELKGAVDRILTSPRITAPFTSAARNAVTWTRTALYASGAQA